MKFEKGNKNISRLIGCGVMVSLCVSAFLTVAGTVADVPQPFGEAEEIVIDPAQLIADSIARADSIAIAETLRLNEAASEAYKNLKFVQYDGITEAELYPNVMDVYNKVQDALKAPRIEESDRTRYKGVLLDLSDLMKRGAMYYSSVGNSPEMARFATAFVDMRLMPLMAGVNFGPADNTVYPALIYCAASDAYNKGDFPKAADYLEMYLGTDTQERREQVTMFLGQACLNAGMPERGADKLIAAVDHYPANFDMLMLALQSCLDAGLNDRMQPLLTKALMMRPEDETLLNAQGRLFENEGNFASAVDIFQRLYEKKPDSKSINQHLGLDLYNLGADYYNRALMEKDEKVSRRYSRQAQAYLQSASQKLEVVVDNDPTNVKYLRALATAYGCLGDAPRLEQINIRLQALGQPTMPMNGMPESIAFADNAKSASGNSGHVPDFQEFARQTVEGKLAAWSKRGEFEKTEDYEKRVTRESVYQKYQELCKSAESDYLNKYASQLRISDLTLQPYDVDNESYLITSAMGPIIVKVPLKNKEAETFKAGWNAVQLRNPKYFINDNRVAIASVDVVSPNGKTYSYNSQQASNYDFTEVRIDMDSFLRGHNTGSAGSDSKGNASKVLRAKSDVDENIPITSRKAENTVALIIGNEDYKQVTKVESAINDAETFAQYCTRTLGIPESQVLVYTDATYAEMLGAIQKLRQLTSTLGNDVDIIFYYAGHGFPDEKDKDSYLLPADGDGVTPATSYPLKKLYLDLASMGGENVMVFLDACFSGATRDGGMLSKTRGIALKPRDTAAEGNMFVISAASDQETALPYKEKNHGLFTYFLLKKLQETKGNITLADLSKYLEETVKKNSMTVNRKMQSPRTTLSGMMRDRYNTKKLRP